MAYTEEDLKRAKTILQNHSSYNTDELLEALKIFNHFRSKEEKVSMFAVLYERGKSKMDSAQTEKDFQETAEIFSNILAHENANELWKECQNQMEKARIYEDAKRKKDSAQTGFEFLKVAGVFARISDFLDAKELEYDCLNKMEYLRKRGIFEDAIKIFGPAYIAKDIEELAKALELFESIKDFPDAHGYVDKIKQCIYKTGKEKMEVAKTEDEWNKVADIFGKIKGFDAADSLEAKCGAEAEKARKKAIYDKAQNIFKSAGEKDTNKLVEALELFESIIDEREIDFNRINLGSIREKIYKNAQEEMSSVKTVDDWNKLADIFNKIPHFSKSNDLRKQCLANAKKQAAYDDAKDKMMWAESEEDWEEAAKIFDNISGFSDACDLNKKCLENAKILRTQHTYSEAVNILNSANEKKDIDEFLKALKLFESIQDNPDAKRRIEHIKECSYETAEEKMKVAKTEDDWNKLADIFDKISKGDPLARSKRRECLSKAEDIHNKPIYDNALNILNSANEKKDIDKLVEALEIFKSIKNYPDAQVHIDKIQQCIYETAEERKNVAKTEYDFKAVANIFDKIKGFNEADSLKQQCLAEAERAKKKAIYDKAQNIFESAANKKDVDELVEALTKFESIQDFPCAQGHIDNTKQCIYKTAKEKMEVAKTEDDWNKLADIFGKIKGFNEADSLKQQCLVEVKEAKKKAIYDKIVNIFNSATQKDVNVLVKAFEALKSIKDFLNDERSIVINQNIYKNTEIANFITICYEARQELHSDWIAKNSVSHDFAERKGKIILKYLSATEIGRSAFSGCTSLTSITIPDSVTEIGENAFAGCTGLTSITIPPYSVTKIGRSAFRGCTSLTSIEIPDSVTEIGESAFGGCTSLTSITIPCSVKEIGNRTFVLCSNLQSIFFHNSVKKIGENAFCGCKSLTYIDIIPDSLSKIGNNAFRDCGLLPEDIKNELKAHHYYDF